MRGPGNRFLCCLISYQYSIGKHTEMVKNFFIPPASLHPKSQVIYFIIQRQTNFFCLCASGDVILPWLHISTSPWIRPDACVSLLKAIWLFLSLALAWLHRRWGGGGSQIWKGTTYVISGANNQVNLVAKLKPTSVMFPQIVTMWTRKVQMWRLHCGRCN